MQSEATHMQCKAMQSNAMQRIGSTKQCKADFGDTYASEDILKQLVGVAPDRIPQTVLAREGFLHVS